MGIGGSPAAASPRLREASRREGDRAEFEQRGETTIEHRRRAASLPDRLKAGKLRVADLPGDVD